MMMERGDRRKSVFDVVKFLSAVSVAVLFMIAGITVLSFLLLKYQFSKEECLKLVYMIYGIASLLGGYTAGRLGMGRPVLSGTVTGLGLYFCMTGGIFLLNLVALKAQTDSMAGSRLETVIKLFIVSFLGGVGGKISVKASYKQ